MKTSKSCTSKGIKKVVLSFEQVTSICRGCLANDRKVFSMTLFEAVFKDMTNIDISPSDGLPQVLCYECVALLHKYFKFRRKVMKSQSILQRYILNGTPIIPDNFGGLQIQTNVIHLHIPGKDANELELQIDKIEGDIDIDKSKEDMEFKEEFIFDDNETNWCEQDPLNDQFDCKSNDSTLSAFSCDLHYAEQIGQGEVPDLKFDFGVEATSKLHQDERDTNTGGAISSHGSNKQRNFESITANKNETREKAEACAKDVKYYNLDDHNYTKNIMNDKLSNDGKSICKRCKKCFSNKSNLEKHQYFFCRGHTRKHTYTSKRKFKCDECSKYFSNKLHLFNHTLTHTERPFQCDICSKTYKHKAPLIQHMGEHFDGERICYICGKSFNSQASLDIHITRHLENKFQCELCMQYFATKLQLKQHIGLHTGERPFKCPLCIKCYRVKGILISHIRDVHGGYSLNAAVDKPYTCDVCNKTLVSETAFKKHASVHNRPYQCDVCSRGFYNKNALITHITVHFSEQTKCAVCGETFRSKQATQLHIMNTHPDYKPFKCHLKCSEGFPNLSELNKHIRFFHYAGKPYKCDVCMKDFEKYSLLQRHSIVHAIEKPFKYKCDICERRFNYKKCLDIHIRMKHTGEKPFQCDVCSKGFAAKRYLEVHMRMHTGEKPFKCDICMKLFTQKSSLNTHYRNTHGTKPISITKNR